MSIVDESARGSSRSPGISYQELLDTDTHVVPDELRVESPRHFGSADISAQRYTSRTWHEKEVQHVWSRAWQFACREEHIPDVGDYVVYDIVRHSFVIVRTAPDTIKAYWNSCLHRGRQLKDFDGHCEGEIRCPFHGFAWDLDGKFKRAPADWDFPTLATRADAGDFQLPEARVATWQGFVFINPDLDAPHFADWVGEGLGHFDRWDLASRYVEAHVAKVIECNWKISQEAFCEAYHADTTHPVTAKYLGNPNSQVDVWDNCSRVITPAGTASPSLWYDVDPDEMMRAMMDTRVDEETPFEIPDGDSCRRVAASAARDRWRPIVGDLADLWSDSEMIDNFDYTIFPNFHPWGSFNRIVYRFRPNGDDHRTSIMEVFLLSPFAGDRPPPAPVHWLGPDESFTDAPELGMIGKIFNQDLANMAKVQQGLESSKKGAVTLSDYMESKVRWLHHKLDAWISLGEASGSVDSEVAVEL